MILTPIPPDRLPEVLDRFAAHLAGHPFALKVFRRIAATLPDPGQDVTAHWPAQVRDAVALAHSLGIATLDEEPARAFSWDGRCIRTRSEPSVVVHEIAHWLVCPPERRGLYDFGLGAGPETGRRAEADAVACVDDETRQTEEALASLLGILWEVELGQPALLAFLEQNWLEGYDRPASVEVFVRLLDRLRAEGFLDAEGRPVRPA